MNDNGFFVINLQENWKRRDWLIRFIFKGCQDIGKLNALQMLVEEEQMSPNEYYDFVYSLKRKKRKRASKSLLQKKSEQSEW